MRFCKYCGSQVEDTARMCPRCGKELPPPKAAAQSDRGPSANAANDAQANAAAWFKKPVLWIVLAVLAAAVVLIAALRGNGRCDYGSCRNKAVPGYDYCYSHKCAIASCGNSCYAYSNYCYTHYLLYDDDAASSSYVPSYQLKISNVTLSSSSLYTYAEGTITNNSSTTVSYVKIKGSFETRSGTVVDTDWTYAVGSEGLAPGESCKWKLSVSKDSSITDCEITVLDYDYE